MPGRSGHGWKAAALVKATRTSSRPAWAGTRAVSRRRGLVGGRAGRTRRPSLKASKPPGSASFSWQAHGVRPWLRFKGGPGPRARPQGCGPVAKPWRLLTGLAGSPFGQHEIAVPSPFSLEAGGSRRHRGETGPAAAEGPAELGLSDGDIPCCSLTGVAMGLVVSTHGDVARRRFGGGAHSAGPHSSQPFAISTPGG